MSLRHPLPYAFARTHHLLLEDDGEQAVLWAAENTPAGAVGEVVRRHRVGRFERESAATLDARIAAAYSGSGSSAAAVVGEVESAVDLSRLLQDLPAVEDLLEAAASRSKRTTWCRRTTSPKAPTGVFSAAQSTASSPSSSSSRWCVRANA